MHATGDVLVNAGNIGTFDFSSTGSWTSWANSNELSAYFSAGNNTVRIQATNSGGLPNLDSVSVTGNAPAAGSCN